MGKLAGVILEMCGGDPWTGRTAALGLGLLVGNPWLERRHSDKDTASLVQPCKFGPIGLAEMKAELSSVLTSWPAT